MKIAVVEDNNEDIQWLQTLMEEYRHNSSKNIQVDYYTSGEQFLKNFILDQYQFVIMDIFMDGMDGIETAKRIKAIDESILIAFLSTSEDEIWRAVNTHGCFDYVQKRNFDAERLHKLLEDAAKKLNYEDEEFTFLNGKQEVSIAINQVQYIVSSDKYTAFTQNNKVYRYRVTFSDIRRRLTNHKNFLVCNRGVILNMDFILRSDGSTFQMEDSTIYPIRRKGRKEIIDTFYDYQFEKLEEQDIF